LEPEQEWVAIAVIARPRGNRGEVVVEPLTSQGDRYLGLRRVFLFGDGSQFEVESVWNHEGRWVFKFRGVDDISAAERLRGAEVRLPVAERRPLEAGEFYQADLIGCEVIDSASETPLGRVAGFQENAGGAGLLELEDGLLIPFARSICVEIDPARRRIRVNLPEGLRDLNRP
jgi:16S rRNA processing protein RimM